MEEEAIDDETMRARYAALLAERNELLAERNRLQKLLDQLMLEKERLERQIIGPKAERVRVAAAQTSILDLLAAIGRLNAGDMTAVDDANAALADARALLTSSTIDKPPPSRKKSPHGRRRPELEDLPVRRLIIEPPERTAPGGELLVKIGEETTELIERVPGQLVRLQVVRTKYMKPEAPASTADTEEAKPVREFVTAPMPERAIPRCMAEPGMLAHVLVSKYADHIPLHRQEVIFKREGFKLARSTLGDWVQASTSMLAHVVDAMWDDAKSNAPYFLTDATGVLVRVEDDDVCKRAHFYVVVWPQRHVLFRFTRDNDGPSVANLLDGFKGYAHADASSVYHELYLRDGDVVEVGCWSHARRKFFEALSRDRERALKGIGYISHLYDAQRATFDAKAGVADTERRAMLARPIVEQFFEWIEKEWLIVEEGTPIHAAVGYARRQREPLSRFLDDGRLRLDTNPAELELRREVVGRKNWLFCGSDSGARWNSIAVSLIGSCQMHGIEPWAYLRDVLTLLPIWAKNSVLDLAPLNWKATAALPATQEKLAQLRLIDRAAPIDAAAATRDRPPARPVAHADDVPQPG